METRIDANLPEKEISGLLQSEGAVPGEVADVLAAAFHEKWRQNAKRVYLCSPYNVLDGRRQMFAARAYAKDAEYSFGVLGVAPKAFLPELLNYSAQKDQWRVIERILFNSCESLFICGDEITPDMFSDIRLAIKKKMPVLVFSSRLYRAMQMTFSPKDISKIAVRHSGIMAMNAINLGSLENKARIRS